MRRSLDSSNASSAQGFFGRSVLGCTAWGCSQESRVSIVIGNEGELVILDPRIRIESSDSYAYHICRVRYVQENIPWTPRSEAVDGAHHLALQCTSSFFWVFPLSQSATWSLLAAALRYLPHKDSCSFADIEAKMETIKRVESLPVGRPASQMFAANYIDIWLTYISQSL